MKFVLALIGLTAFAAYSGADAYYVYNRYIQAPIFAYASPYYKQPAQPAQPAQKSHNSELTPSASSTSDAVNPFRFPIRSNAEINLLTSVDGKSETITLGNEGTHFFSNNPTVKKFLETMAAVMMADPSNVKGSLPTSSKVLLEFIGTDGKIEKIEISTDGLNFSSDNAILNSLFEDIGAAIAKAMAGAFVSQAPMMEYF